MAGRIIILSTLFFLMTHLSVAQTYPVSASTQIIPPYSTYLADYVAPGSNKLALNIFLGDINRADIQVRLRLRIEGQGIRIETKPEYLPTPMTLQGGVPERLIASDLEQYFRPENLNFQGITKQQFLQTGQLPEGLYQFCFEVLEYNRGVRISNSACTMAWLILNDPPIINLPRNNEKLRAQAPQYITFQWTPRHTGSPNSAFATEYEFALVELWPETRNPNDAILTTPPIYETTTASTTLIYGPAEPQLEPGRHYAFRVRAKSISGVEELDLFKNQGYSQVHKFIYGDACTVPVNIMAEPVNSAKIKLTWGANFNHTNFSVRYRKAGDNDAEWYEEDSFFEDIEISGLTEETTYEYQVVGGCGPFVSEYSQVATVTTDALPSIEYNCGLPPADYGLENTTPVASLQVGDIIYAGDFDVRITEVQGANGSFSGRGSTVVPFMDNITMGVDFENISINEVYRMVAGTMDVSGVGVDVLPGEVTELLDELYETIDDIDGALEDADEALEEIDNALDIVDDIIDEVSDYLPDDIKDEIDDAKDELADARDAVRNAPTPEARDQAKADVKEAKKKLKNGVKKALDYYAKALKDIIEFLKKSFENLRDEKSDELANSKQERDEADKTLRERYEQLKDQNLDGIALGQMENSESTVLVSESSTYAEDELNQLKSDEVAGDIIEKLPVWVRLERLIKRNERIIEFALNMIGSESALKDFINQLKDNSDDFIKGFMDKKKAGASNNELQKYTNDFIANNIESFISE